ncbi:MAG: hypothetical protein RRC34_12455 [Lentisphaeria bacterium]|nr:hypothetical protein [Lentisphaeria bacterium]
MAMVKIKRKEEEAAARGDGRYQAFNIGAGPEKGKARRKNADGEGRSGCRTVILLFLLVIVGVACALYQFRNYYTSGKPGYVRNYRASTALTEQAVKRVDALRAAIKANGAMTIVFSERELNALLQKNIQTVNWKGQADISLDEHLSIAYTLPLTGIPGFKGRHLTGQMVFAFDENDNGVDVTLTETKLNGHDIPAFVRNKLKGDAFKEKVLAAPALQDLASHLESVTVVDQQLVVKVRKKTPATVE